MRGGRTSERDPDIVKRWLVAERDFRVDAIAGDGTEKFPEHGIARDVLEGSCKLLSERADRCLDEHRLVLVIGIATAQVGAVAPPSPLNNVKNLPDQFRT